MPQVGERRTGATETVEWNGSRWVPAAGDAAPPAEEGALSRFFGGAMATSPLNPMNLVRAVSHPIDTLGHMVGDPLANLLKAGGDVKAAVTGERGDRLTSALQAVEHLGGAVPLIGPAGIAAGEKIGNGDIAGGAGELAGLASGAAVPEVVGRAPSAMMKTGDALTRGGQALKGTGISMGGFNPLSSLGLAEAVLRMDPKGLAVAGAPYALEYGGKGLSAAGKALEGLKRGPSEKPTWDPAGPSKRAASEAVQQAAREKASGVTPEDIGNVPYTVPDPELTGSDIANATDSYSRAIPGEFASRADSMGRNTIRSFRDAGYDVDEGGFRSLGDIDRLSKGPKPQAPPPAEVPEPFETDVPLGDEGDFLTEHGTPALTDMQRLAARSAERYGRRYRPEF